MSPVNYTSKSLTCPQYPANHRIYPSQSRRGFFYIKNTDAAATLGIILNGELSLTGIKQLLPGEVFAPRIAPTTSIILLTTAVGGCDYLLISDTHDYTDA